MPAMQGGPSPHRWNEIRRLPLYRAIQTLGEYDEATLFGALDALAYLRTIEPATAGRRRQQGADWWAAGEVETLRAGHGPGVDVDAIPDNTTCDVIFLPPMYLVCLRDFPLAVVPRPEP